MTAEERKFERARVQTISCWERALVLNLGLRTYGPLMECGFCTEYQDTSFTNACCKCPLVYVRPASCCGVNYLFRNDFRGRDENLLTTLTVLITLHHMAADFVTVDGDPLDEPLIEWVEE